MKYLTLLLMLNLLLGCGPDMPPPAPTDPASIKASQDEQKQAADAEAASLKTKK
ncbi:hypothetical protein BH11PLA2_BH11PLA2_04060 [soil metagenome]